MLRLRFGVSVFAVAALLACRKSKTSEAAPAPSPLPVASASASEALRTTTLDAGTSPTLPAKEDEKLAEYTGDWELALDEGKVLPLPKFKPADAEVQKTHQGVLQRARDEMLASKCTTTKAVAVSFVPATYIHCVIGSQGASGDSVLHNLYSIELDHYEIIKDEPSTPYTLLQTPQSYFFDILSDGSVVYVLRRSKKTLPGHDGSTVECIGKRWADGEVKNVELPDYPTRGRDVDGDGKNDFPEAIFDYGLADWRLKRDLPVDDVCNVTNYGSLSIPVVGVMSWSGKKWYDNNVSFRGFYERKLKAARARAERIRGFLTTSDAGEKRASLRIKKIGSGPPLGLTNTCALDAAQTAAEQFAYARILGATAEKAIAEADATMRGFALRPETCEGLTNVTGHGEFDQWPDMREALLKSNLPIFGDADVDAGTPKPSPSSSSSKP